MRSRYFLLFLILAIVLVLLFYYFRLIDFRHSEKAIFEIISTRKDIHTVLEDGVWRIDHPNFIPQFGGDLQNTGVYPGDGLREIQIMDSPIMLDDSWPFHKGKLVYKIRHRGLICSSPAVYDRIIYFGTNDGHFYAIDIDSWEEKWVVRIGRASERKRGMHFRTDSCPPAPAIFSSPVIYNGAAYFGTAYGYVYALDIKDGSIIWKSEIPGLHLANPKIYKDYLYIGSKDRHLYKIDTKRGNIAWNYKTQGEIITTSAIYEDRIFINCQEGHLYAIDTEGNLCWKIDVGVSTKNSPVIYDGIVFLDANYFHAFKTKNGREIWRAGPFEKVSQCAVSKGRVYFSGVIIDDKDKDYRYNYLYSLIARNGKEVWKSEISSWEIYTNLPAEYIISDVVEPEIPSNQIIISGDMVHLLYIANGWWRTGTNPFRRDRGEIFGFVEDEYYYVNFPDYPHPNPNIKHNYALEVNSLHSPATIYDEVMYYGAEIYDKDGCYTGLYAMQSMQDEYRWQPRLRDWSISYPLMSENAIVLYDLIIKEKNNIQKEENPYIDTNLYTAEFHIMAYDIQSQKEIYSGTYHTEATGPLTILNRSSATHSDKLFIEACVLKKVEREEISSEGIPISREIRAPFGDIRKCFDIQLISNTYCAFDIQTGELIWKYEIGQKILNTPPLVYEDKIYIGSCYILDDLFDIPDNLKDSYNIFISLDSKDGKEIWKTEIVGNVLSQPLVHNDVLYFGTDKGYVYAIDRFEGKILWMFYINGGISTTPAVYNDIIFIGSWNWNIYAVDAQTGKGKWKYRTRGEVRGELIAHEDQLYFLSRIPNKELMTLPPYYYNIHDSDGKILRTILTLPSQIEIEIGSISYLQSINIITGINKWKIMWHYTLGFIPPNISNFLIDSDVLYILIHKGYRNNFLQAIDIKTGSILWDKEINYKDFHYISSRNQVIKILEDKLNLILLKREQPLDIHILTIDAKTGEMLAIKL